MKKKITIMLLVISLITTTLFTASFADTTCSPCEEIENIRNSVRSVYDIDAGIYNRLETAILQKYKDVKKGDWYMSVMCKLVGLTYGADKTATRATAAAIVIKYLDTRERAKVTIPSSRAPMVLRQDDPNRPMAIEGDTFIKADGTSVVLKIGPSGVLGEGQGVATEIGRAHPNGELIKDGDLCSSDEFYGQPYLVDKKTGEGHYLSEWDDIANRLIDEALEKLGHPADGTTYGPWLMYKWGTWYWVGPN